VAKEKKEREDGLNLSRQSDGVRVEPSRKKRENKRYFFITLKKSDWTRSMLPWGRGEGEVCFLSI